MSRRKVVFEKDQFYHVYNRGSNKQNIFFSHENYLFFLKRVQKYKAEFSISVIAYCLMPNHFHFLLKQKEDASI